VSIEPRQYDKSWCDLSPSPELRQRPGLSKTLVYRESKRGNLAHIESARCCASSARTTSTGRERCRVRPAARLAPMYEPPSPGRRTRSSSGAFASGTCRSRVGTRGGSVNIQKLPDGRVSHQYYWSARITKRQRTFTRLKDAQKFAAEIERRKESESWAVRSVEADGRGPGCRMVASSRVPTWPSGRRAVQTTWRPH